MLRRFIAGLFLALFSVSSFAQTTCSEYQGSFGATVTGWHKTIPAAGTELAEILSEDEDTSTYDFTYSYTSYSGTGTSGSLKLARTRVTRSTGVVQNVNATASWARRSVPCTCQAGQTFEKTFFAGWGRDTTSSESIPGTEPSLPYNYCDGQCSSTMDEVVNCWVDTEASPNGNYEQTCTYSYKTTGEQCTTQTPDPEKSPDPPPPDPGDPGDGDPGDGDPGDGDPGDGDPGDGDPGDGDPGDCVPTAENPCDDSGGGGGGTTDPGEGEGEGEGDEKGAECGVPGKPSCSVKVDETGTAPVDLLIDQVQEMHDYTRTLSGENGEINQMNDDLKNMNAGSVFGMNDWSWSFQLPTGCTPLVMADFNVTIDPCQWQSTIHDLMSMIWIISTFFGVLWIARGTF